MRILTIVRAVAWFGVVITFWSNNVLWGDDIDAGSGPPGQWQRQVVGAGCLALVAAISLSVSGRRGNPPSVLARGIAIASAVGMLLIGYVLRREALDGFAHLIEGPGWTWMFAGGGFVLSASVMSLGIKPAPAKSDKADKSAKPARSGKSSGKRKRRR
jgi:hypothetical protein